ncbi:MAG: sugar transferase [Pelagimonas sp.]|jgi:lipopolysaccharide/colanic/teichoic acid biosynthesis glycosyltransferase|nr:sugar transferase [Pelagimonas sp.]
MTDIGIRNGIKTAQASEYDLLSTKFDKATLYTRFGKRALDLTLALLLVPVLAPVVLVLALLVRRDGGDALFGHRRIGRNGKVFKCWKIRTMVPNAERRLLAYLRENPEAAAEWARDHKLENDPRITKLGNFLRRSSLDELPQLWNVIKGEMSLVGPRPIVRSELHKYGTARAAYLAMKPGVTGLWQVSGRNDVSYDERIAMDLTYADSMSMTGDLGIIAKTAGAVLDRTGK